MIGDPPVTRRQALNERNPDFFGGGGGGWGPSAMVMLGRSNVVIDGTAVVTTPRNVQIATKSEGIFPL